MDFRNELLAIAQIAIAIAGFSGVVAASLQRDGLHVIDRFRFVAIFSLAFSALVLAFVPIALVHLGFDSVRLWRVSSSVLVAAWFAGALPGAYIIRQVISAVEVESHIPTALLLIPSILNLLVQIGNVGGWFWEPNFVAYLIGLFAYLFVAGLSFVYVVLFRPSS